jgi:3-hydroxyisobutyrate dehydrogenase-like beta-hydroxyacid dehydrogenase
MTQVGIIGLGLVGSAIAERLLAAGYQVAGFDVVAKRQAELQAMGGCPFDSAAAVIERADRIILSLPTSDVVGEVLATLPEQLPGKTIFDTTTGEPSAMDKIGCGLARRGAQYLLATIAGSSAQVRRGEVIVITGGPDEVAASCADMLQSFSRQQFHVGSWLAAARMKLVVNLVLGLNRAVLAEALSFAAACRIDPRKALEVLQAGPAFSRVMDTKGMRMVGGDFSPEARLAQHAKDVRLILEQGEDVGARLPLSQLHIGLLEQLIKNGWGDEDNSAIMRAFDPPAEPV